VILGASLVIPGGPLAGQGPSVAVTPFVGLYAPAGRLGTWNLTGIEGGRVTTVVEQGSSVALGARVSGRVADRLAVEGALMWAPSSVRTATSSDLLFQAGPLPEVASSTLTGTAVWLGSVSLLYDVLRPAPSLAFYASVGPVLISRTGSSVWTGVDGRTDIGGLAGVGLRFRVGSAVAVRLDAEDAISSARLTDGATGAATASRIQNDLLFSAALSIGILGRR
jgi:hypothetical protein